MQPFVRSREDLMEVRGALDAAGGKKIRLFAKIENMAGVNSLGELIPHCDEIVIARGDLGNAVPLWELPAVQKRIAAACRAAGRDFMVVTQMLDSMTHRQVPTRAEVSDIFNAVLDGAASVMVTGETAAGDYPVLAIRYLTRTVREAEAYIGSVSSPAHDN
jgi:pyruvate kinase